MTITNVKTVVGQEYRMNSERACSGTTPLSAIVLGGALQIPW